jgi:hypothetical protein
MSGGKTFISLCLASAFGSGGSSGCAWASSTNHEPGAPGREEGFHPRQFEVKRDSKRWVPHSGASNHMTSVREVFAELVSNIRGIVKFGDGSMVEIEGIGTVLFVCKNGEHHSLTVVYLIPTTTNIIGLGQLDEIGYEVIISGGLMRVRDDQNRLLAKAQQSSNRLYVLNLSIAQPMSFVVKGAEGAWLWHA